MNSIFGPSEEEFAEVMGNFYKALLCMWRIEELQAHAASIVNAIECNEER